MTDIILVKLHEWTAGLNSLDGRTSVYAHIRNIPYMVIPEIRDREKGPREILSRMSGSCTPKHFLLGKMFQAMDIPIKFLSFPYSWDQKNVAYPDPLRDLARKIPTEYHLACQAYLNGKWVIVDATWDPPLAKAGFPVNQAWDGFSDTEVAVDFIEMVEHPSAEERDEFVKLKKASWTEEDKRLTSEFIDGLNRWLKEVRAIS